MQAELDAHDTSIQCLEHCQARKEVATCGMGSKVKVWSVRQPAQIRLALVLDHTDPEKRAAQQAAAKAKVPRDVNAEGKTDMQWLTCSDIDGLGVGQKVPAASALPSIVAEAIANAAEDVPAITQVRWLGYKQCWVTAADDEIMRLWSTSGERLESIPYKGGSCRWANMAASCCWFVPKDSSGFRQIMFAGLRTPCLCVMRLLYIGHCCCHWLQHFSQESSTHAIC
eukprot:GHRR01023011.1.p1 GENE.GHRR01023011.1~~GHRR01023011.1.p1  ORF type:complete len:226 (+),score=53.15 GHRR01023011.1:2627-3304(+)